MRRGRGEGGLTALKNMDRKFTVGGLLCPHTYLYIPPLASATYPGYAPKKLLHTSRYCVTSVHNPSVISKCGPVQDQYKTVSLIQQSTSVVNSPRISSQHVDVGEQSNGVRKYKLP